jgi:hypothetical protein
MSGTFPSSPGFTSTGFRSTSYNLSSTSVSGRTQVRGIGSQRWEFTASFPPMSRDEYGPINAFLLKQRGMLESFQIVLPIISAKASSASGTVTSGTASIGATACNITGLTGTLKAGDVIKFASHNKVYMLTADRAGDGAIAFEPPLMVAVTAATVTYDSVPFTVRLNNDVQEFNYATDGTVSYEIDMIEVI